MITLSGLAAEALGEFLAEDCLKTFGAREDEFAHGMAMAARLAMECLGNCDALYHNVEHSLLVALAGRDIVRGRMFHERVTVSDWAHYIVACIAHDIGFVRGILKGDTASECVVDASGGTVTLPRGSSDAALAPYHVDRGKMFVMERLGGEGAVFDAARIASAIEFTRFPPPEQAEPVDHPVEAMLVRGADLIGQLGDPCYLHKANALFCEFREIGVAGKLGYASPADVIEKYPDFFWRSVSPHIAPAVRFLKVTVEGRTWLAHLYANVFSAGASSDVDSAMRAEIIGTTRS
jgi:hypothetical protein